MTSICKASANLVADKTVIEYYLVSVLLQEDGLELVGLVLLFTTRGESENSKGAVNDHITS